MGAIVLYLVSLGLFWLAALLVPFLFVPALRMMDAVRQEPMSTPKIMFFIQVIITILLLLLTQLIWVVLGYKTTWFPWFPAIVGVQNFIASRNPNSNEMSKVNSNATTLGAGIFIVLGYFW